MWPILKAELEYNRLIAVNVLFVTVTGFLLLHFWPVLFGPVSNRNVGYMALCYMYFNFVMAMLTLPWTKEKRARYLIAQRVSARNIDLAHLALFVLYWMEILALFIAFVVLSPHYSLDSATGIALLSQTGVVFTVYACIAILSVFPDSVWRKMTEIAVLLMFAFIAVAGIVHTYQGNEEVHVVDRLLSWAYRSSSGSFLLFFTSVGLVLFFIFYPWRRSYAAG